MKPTLTLRVEFGNGRALGPGKIGLLEAIDKTGSITQAGRALGMSYRHWWSLVDDLNNCFSTPVIIAKKGGSDGGGAGLTPLGHKLIKRYRAIEARALAATGPHLHEIESSLKDSKALRPVTSISLPMRSRR